MSCDDCRDGSAGWMGRRDAQVRGGSHLSEPPGFPGHVRATCPDARTRCRQLSEGVPRHSSPGDEQQGGPGRAVDDAERGYDDALSRLARLESASTSTFAAPNWSAGTTTRRDNIVSKKELKNVANFGTKNGPAYQDWVSDVKTATEQVDELMVHVIEWIDRQNTLLRTLPTQNWVTTSWTWSGL